MEKKKWYKSKAMWAGIVAVAIAGYNTASIEFNLPAIPDFAYGILGALGLYGRVKATHKIN